MNEVFGQSYANLYDALNHSKDYQAEVDFANAIIQKASSVPISDLSLLDVGCGTGRHLQCFRESYAHVEGLDRSSSMVEISRQRNPDVSISLGTVESQKDNLGKFDVVVSLFDVLSYQIANADVLSFLRHARELLKPEGLLLVDYWHLAGLIREPPATRVTTLQDSTRKIIRISTPRTNWVTSTTTVSIWTQESNSEQIVSETLELHEMRAFTIQEIEIFAQTTGLRVVANGGWLHTNSTCPTDGDWHGFSLLRWS